MLTVVPETTEVVYRGRTQKPRKSVRQLAAEKAGGLSLLSNTVILKKAAVDLGGVPPSCTIANTELTASVTFTY